MDDDARLHAAEAFLQEAVYRSRCAQAETLLLSQDERLPDGGQCGLGARAGLVLDLSPKAEQLFAELWPEGLAEEHLPAIQECMRQWVERQDALDRKRNHFMKAFRGEHGFDRETYDEEQAAAYRAGLDAVNEEVDEGRRKVARGLLGAER